MKTSPYQLARAGRVFRRGIIFACVVASLPLAAWAQSNTVAVAGSFVQELQYPNTGHTVDTRVDNSVGTTKSGITYVLAADYFTNSYLRKFDASGGEAVFANGGTQVTIAGIAGSALAVIPGTTNLYIAGGSKVYQVSTESGQLMNSVDAGSGVSLKSILWDGTNVVVCGNFSGGTRSVLGLPATARGNTAGIIIKFSKSLSSTPVGLITFGCNDSSANNTANSIVVDENSDLYVAGALGAGTFNSDVFNAGSWNITEKTGSSVATLEDARALLTNPNVAATTSTATTINTSTGVNEHIYRATGIFIAPAAGSYTFTSTTDDGNWLYIDNQQLIYDDYLHPPTATSVTVTLAQGLHSVDWLYFNHGGNGSGTFTYSGPGVSAGTFVPAANIGSNKGYVLKFDGGLTALKGVYSSQASVGQGSEVKELSYAQGFVYGVGYWKGNADNPAINPTDASDAGSQNVEVLKLDTALLLKARATVKGGANNTGYSITVDDSGNAYLTGSQGPASVDFFGNGDPTNHPFTSISSAKASIFIAQLDSNFTFQWVNTPTTPVPDFDFTVATPRVRWNSALQRVFWLGYFSNGSLLMGNPNTMQTLNGPEGFIAVLDPTGKYAERVLLTILSNYGISGVQVQPFGGPSGGTNNVQVMGVNTKPVIKGAQVTASVPTYIYWDLTNNDITTACLANPTLIDSAAETRIGCVGYSVGNNVANGVSSSYTFTISQDTIVQFNWTVEHALRVQSDFSETEGHDPGAIGHIVGLKSDASGSPDPTVEKHWVAENSPVIASVDAYEDDQNYLSQGLSVRYVVTGYDAYGPANTLGSPGTTNFITFLGNDTRRQVPQFLMTGPARVTYHWKLKIGIQVATTGLSSASFPYIHVNS
ncbi:MAG TPA: PA14 domain-containing protein, partial [Verrucomicrobiae bacterium]|nr:PA14 domain-containing protein [Verrucomicrobiae bacterium]